MGEIVGNDKDYYAKIGSRIAEIREKRGLTSSQLAYKIGVSESSMSRYERGGSKIDFPTLELIAYILKVPAKYLLDWNDEDTYYLDNETRKRIMVDSSNKESMFLMEASRKLNPDDYQYVKELIERLTEKENHSDDD